MNKEVLLKGFHSIETAKKSYSQFLKMRRYTFTNDFAFLMKNKQKMVVRKFVVMNKFLIFLVIWESLAILMMDVTTIVQLKRISLARNKTIKAFVHTKIKFNWKMYRFRKTTYKILIV